MGVVVPRAPEGGCSPGPLKSLDTAPILLVNYYLGKKFHKKFRLDTPFKGGVKQLFCECPIFFPLFSK